MLNLLFLLSLLSKKLSGFVVSLYKAVVEFLRAPNCEALAFSKSIHRKSVQFSFKAEVFEWLSKFSEIIVV